MRKKERKFPKYLLNVFSAQINYFYLNFRQTRWVYKRISGCMNGLCLNVVSNNNTNMYVELLPFEKSLNKFE